MDIEQLKLVLALVKEVADGSLTAFLLWLCFSYLLPYLVGTVAILCGYRFLSTFILSFTENAWFEERAKQLGQSYTRPYNGTDIPETKEAIVRILNSYKNK